MKKIKYYLLVTANPLSDSKAALSIFRMIRRLDILSENITVFLPGFHSIESDEPDSQKEVMEKIDKIKAINRDNNEDYHGGNSVYHIYVEKEGDIYFNDADFSNFMLDLEDKSSKFDYYGKTELVVIPTVDGEIIYENLSTYSLDALSEECTSKIEEFLISVFKLIKKDDDSESIRLLAKIDDSYKRIMVRGSNHEFSEVIIKLDNEILQYMKWNEKDEIFFISYSTKDEFHAYALKGLLEKNEKKVWMAPEGIPNGFDYAQAIPAALRITTRFLVLLSSNSAKSEWVRREVGKAISNKKRIDGIFLDDFNMEELQKYDHLSFMLENVQLKYNIQELFENKGVFETLTKQL